LDKQIEKYLYGGERKVILKLNKQEYIFDKLIFYILVCFLLLTSVIILYANNMDKSNHVYVKCEADKVRCFNPYYQDTTFCGKTIPSDSYLCTTELIEAPYEYGTPSPWYVDYFGTITILLIIISLITNHLIYNKQFKFNQFKEDMKEDLKEL